MISELIHLKPFRLTLVKPNYLYGSERKTKKMQNKVNAIQRIQKRVKNAEVNTIC